MGEGDSALAAFAAYRDVGGDRGLALLERARTLYYLRRLGEAHDVYYEAAAAPLSDEVRAEFRADLLWILTPDERAAFDAAPAGEMRTWLERFWAERDAQDVRVTGERLAEHYRRYFYAWRHFRLVSRHRRYTNEAVPQRPGTAGRSRRDLPPARRGGQLVGDAGAWDGRHGHV